MQLQIKSVVLLWPILLLTVFVAAAQRGEHREQLKTTKIALITEKLELTEKQAESFCPVYNEYDNQRRELQKQIRSEGRKLKDAHLQEGNEAKIKASVLKIMDFKEQQVALERKYIDKFLAVISPSQLAALYGVEKEFTRMLLRRLRDREMPPPPPGE